MLHLLRMDGGVCHFPVAPIATRPSRPPITIPTNLSVVRRSASGCDERHTTAPSSKMIRYIAPNVGTVKSSGGSRIPITCAPTANRNRCEDRRRSQNRNSETTLFRSWFV